MVTFKEAASIAAARLSSQYRERGVFKDDFWFGGNALHAFITYCLASGERDERQLLPFAYEQVYKPGTANSGWWRDDYGWWGNAFCAALRNRNALGYQDSKYDTFFGELLGAAVSCWKELDSNWRDTTYNHPVGGDDVSDNAVADASILGGSFNQYPDSSDPPMSGRNSVTNEGFWLLSMELLVLTKNSSYAARARDEAKWFWSWLDEGKLLNGAGLVLERPTGNRTLPSWYWSGDQGLFMNACVLQRSHEWPPPYTDTLGAKIARTVIETMTDADGVLHESMDFASSPGLSVFTADYATGKGIFMRNLGELCVRLGDAWVEQHCRSFIRTNAAAVWRNRIGDQLPFNWNPAVPGGEPRTLTGKSEALCNLILQAAGLDALSLAMRYDQNGEIG